MFRTILTDMQLSPFHFDIRTEPKNFGQNECETKWNWQHWLLKTHIIYPNHSKPVSLLPNSLQVEPTAISITQNAWQKLKKKKKGGLKKYKLQRCYKDGPKSSLRPALKGSKLLKRVKTLDFKALKFKNIFMGNYYSNLIKILIMVKSLSIGLLTIYKRVGVHKGLGMKQRF